MTNQVDTSTSPDTRQEGSTLVIGLLLVSAFVVILNETIMSVAIPKLIVDFHITAATGQWLTSAFLLTMAVVIPVTGFLIQRFSTRAMFLSAMTLFIIGTIVAIFAPGFSVLLVARIIQAFGTSIMMPLLMTTVLTLVEPAHRGRIMGNISIVISVAPAIGPTISGLILNSLSWRFLFICVLPIALAALIVGALKLRNVGEPRRAPFDALSVVLSAFAFGGIVYGLSSIATIQADGATTPIIALAVGVIGLALFVWRQTRLQHHDRALLDLRTFRSPVFTLAIIALSIGIIVFFGSLIVLPLFLENVLRLPVLQVGLLLLPGGLIMGALSPVVGNLYDRVGPRPLVIPGSILISAGLWLLTTLTHHSSAAFVLVVYIVLSIGLAFLLTPLLTTALGSVPAPLYSYGSATFSTVQQLAGAAGTALFITLMTVGTSASSSRSAMTAMAHGVHTAFLWGAIVSLAGLIAACFVRAQSTGDGTHTGDAA
ncbi:DHA2 family efflux MFS transporter permease subunit [Frondihabitans cladoniiphilus]|uniref:DHA2 family efflux MFS transporter permease subunit n=1 Tax=Frondihabitans cladoniiphilus TaxID=715785 RepID=A0ABP8W7E3_9MICO